MGRSMNTQKKSSLNIKQVSRDAAMAILEEQTH
jgi:hypothetical protein